MGCSRAHQKPARECFLNSLEEVELQPLDDALIVCPPDICLLLEFGQAAHFEVEVGTDYGSSRYARKHFDVEKQLAIGEPSENADVK